MRISTELIGLDSVLSRFENYNSELQNKIELFLSRLGELGFREMQTGFLKSQYDGAYYAISVSQPSITGTTMTLTARGKNILFIEFGTGIVYEDDHPKAQELGMIRGGYGQGKGNQRTWVYYGVGDKENYLRTTDKGDLYKTHGNPANKPVYNAGQEMRNNIIRIAKEVFGN